MFSRTEKQKIASAVESVLREINHPEMDTNNIRFNLHVYGAEVWSWADIHESRPDDTRTEDPNPWNEKSREIIAALQESADSDRELVAEWDRTLPPLPA